MFANWWSVEAQGVLTQRLRCVTMAREPPPLRELKGQGRFELDLEKEKSKMEGEDFSPYLCFVGFGRGWFPQHSMP